MLHQIHWQFRDGQTQFIAQRDIETYQDLRDFVNETVDIIRGSEQPVEAILMMCNSDSPDFWWTLPDNVTGTG